MLFRSTEIPVDANLTLGVPGLGTVGEIIGMQLKNKYPNLLIVPFKSSSDAIVAVLGGQIDLTVGFISDLERYPNLQVLGITGNNKIKNYLPLSRQGFNQDLDRMGIKHSVMVPTDWPEGKIREVQEILMLAEKSKPVQDSYEPDSCSPFQITRTQLNFWFKEQNQFWTQMVKRIRKD